MKFLLTYYGANLGKALPTLIWEFVRSEEANFIN